MISYELFGMVPKTSMDRSDSLCMVDGYRRVRGVWIYLDVGETSYRIALVRGLIPIDPVWFRTGLQEKEC